MTSPAHGSAGPWADDGWPTEAEWPDEGQGGLDDHELLAQEPASEGGYFTTAETGRWDAVDPGSHDPGGHDPTSDHQAGESWSAWDETEDASADGLTGRALILGTSLVTAGCAVLNLALTGGQLTFFFDLCFVVICLVGAMAVRRQDLFTAGVLPPLVFAGVIGVLAVVAPDAIESGPGLSTVFLSGLASHAVGLVAGYGVALLAIAARMVNSPKPVR